MENKYTVIRIPVCLLLLVCYSLLLLNIIVYASSIIKSSNPEAYELINSCLEKYVWSIHPALSRLKDLMAVWGTWPLLHPAQIPFFLFVLSGLLAVPGPGSDRRVAKALYFTCALGLFVAISVLIVVVSTFFSAKFLTPIADFAHDVLSNMDSLIFMMALSVLIPVFTTANRVLRIKAHVEGERKRLMENLERLGTLLSSFKPYMSSGEFDELAEKIGQLWVRTARARTLGELDEVGIELRELARGIYDVFSEAVSNTSSKLDEVRRELDRHAEDINSIRSLLKIMEQVLAGYNLRLQDEHAKIEELAGRLNSLRRELDNLARELSELSLEGNLERGLSILKELEGMIGEIRGACEELERYIKDEARYVEELYSLVDEFKRPGERVLDLKYFHERAKKRFKELLQRAGWEVEELDRDHWRIKATAPSVPQPVVVKPSKPSIATWDEVYSLIYDLLQQAEKEREKHEVSFEIPPDYPLKDKIDAVVRKASIAIESAWSEEASLRREGDKLFFESKPVPAAEALKRVLEEVQRRLRITR